MPIVYSTLWTAVCFVGVRIAWINGEAKGAAVFFQLLAAVPLAYWALVLWRGRAGHWTRRETGALIFGALLLRCILIGAPPAQSDDVYRYLWEGRVQKAGGNPFEHAPDSDALAALRDANWEGINHPEYTAIYPPLAQGSFLLVAFVRPSILAMKVFFTLCDVLTLLVLLRWLAKLGRSPAWAALWTFHPLVIAEFSGNGHLDSLMILMTVTALWALEEGWEKRALFALAGAVAAKLIPLLLLPYFFWKLKRRAWVLLPPVIAILSYLPYAGAGSGVWASLWIYQRDWLYNAPVFDFWRDVVYGTDGWMTRYGFYGTLALIGGALWLLKKGPASAALPVLGFYQVAGPVVHPWYLCIFVALLCVRPGGWPWLWLTVATPMAYWTEVDPSTRIFVWGPFLAGLGLQAGVILRNRVRSIRGAEGCN